MLTMMLVGIFSPNRIRRQVAVEAGCKGYPEEAS